MTTNSSVSADSHLDPGPKRKRGRRQMGDVAGSSYESPNYFAVLSDSESDTKTADSVPNPTPKKWRIPPIVLYSYLTHHSATINAVNEKLSSPVEVKTKSNRLLLYTKSESDYTNPPKGNSECEYFLSHLPIANSCATTNYAERYSANGGSG